jgi:hypothetical protein
MSFPLPPAGEFDAFLARAACGRNELELARRDEADKRQNRFRALVQVGLVSPNIKGQQVSSGW